MSLNKKQNDLLEQLYEQENLKSRPKIMQTLQEDYPDVHISHGAVAKFLQDKKGKKKVIFKEEINRDAPVLELHRDEEEEVRTSPRQRVENEVDDESDIVKEAKEVTVLARGYHDINKFIKKDRDNHYTKMQKYKNF